MQTAPTPNETLAAAWTTVRTILAIVTGLFGPPTELAALPLVPRAWRRDIVAWLRPAEALVRRLLLIRAAELAGALKPPPKRAIAEPWAFRPTDRATPSGNSAKWRGVRFVLIPKASQSRPGVAARGKWPAALPKIVITQTTQEAYAEKPLRNRPAPDRFAWAVADETSDAYDLPYRPPYTEKRPGRTVAPKPFTGLALAERLEGLIRAVHKPEPLAQRLARRLRAAGETAPAAVKRMTRPLPDNPRNPARTALKDLAGAVEKAGVHFSSA